MSERSIYLRDQAAKCQWHASQMTSPETIAELHKIAGNYLIEASQIEKREEER